MACEAVVRRMRSTMALNAPSHRQRSHARDAIHLRHIAVARFARDVGQHVRLVIEPNETWQGRNFDPRDAFARVVIPAELGNFRMLGHDESMTADAALDRRHACERRSTHAAVTQLAVETIRTHVIAMMEINRLFWRVRRCGTRPRNGQGNNQNYEPGRSHESTGVWRAH